VQDLTSQLFGFVLKNLFFFIFKKEQTEQVFGLQEEREKTTE